MLQLDGDTLDFTTVSGIYAQGLDGLKITNTWVYSTGIGVYADALGIPVNLHTSIANSYITSTGNYGIEINTNNQGFSIVGNTITFGGSYGLYMNGSSSLISASDNTMVATAGGTGFLVAGDGISLVGNSGSSSVAYAGTPGRVQAIGNQGDGGGYIGVRSAVPTSGTWKQGDIVMNSGAVESGIAAWICGTVTCSGSTGWVSIPAAATASSGWGTDNITIGGGSNLGKTIHYRSGTTCTTGTTQFATCSYTITWPNSGFADSNYTAVCTLDSLSNLSTLVGLSSKTATQISGTNINLSSGVAASAGIDCLAVHD